jgi:hypothetical protein
VVFIILFISIFLFTIINDNEYITYKELYDDHIDSNEDGHEDSYKSFNEGDEIKIKDKIEETMYKQDLDATIIIFKSKKDRGLIFKGDLRNDYYEGDLVIITLHIKNYYDSNEGTVERIEELENGSGIDKNNIEKTIDFQPILLGLLSLIIILICVILFFKFRKKKKKNYSERLHDSDQSIMKTKKS